MIVIPRPILIALGWASGEAMTAIIEMKGNRLFIAKKPTDGEAKLAKFKARLRTGSRNQTAAWLVKRGRK